LPCLRAVSKTHGPLALVQFDAHIDTWGDYFGGKYFHGSPFRRAIEEQVIDPAAYVQVGIRGPMYGEDEDFAYQRAHAVTTIDIGMAKRDGMDKTMARVREIAGTRAVYVTFDIDAVDPAFAPGTGTPEVGGFTSYEAQELVRGLAGLKLVGCDVVEVAPPFDGPGQITALLAANIMFELLCVIASSSR
jgi:agmatinase